MLLQNYRVMIVTAKLPSHNCY